ncbi:hypothetical protein [Pseudodesulfovibrio senegalensis]|uniref:Uncharacterized protein n=1 Tax=Pseudodesulfovibrio senegalensis TaxID=1721087 RepID=A0A6N6N5M5_9BACT|nr:hypothetical protein [Pseudodesulfovibrio senegalensis]KAB1442779.1 hypothetical protein F8A88_00435 [Pseudodesulfovibrio senegalensis]
MSWVVAESYPVEEMEKEGVSPAWLRKRWEDTAEDMALIPETNVRVEVRNGVCFIEVSDVMMSCLRGM